jgi:NAD(P)H-dependent FMN reductase
MARILAFAGSLRKDSLNRKLVAVAAEGAGKAGAEVTLLDLKQYPLTPYDGDDEDAGGLPESAVKLKEIFKAHDAFIISSPEYNSGYPGTLKNIIDWISRPMEGEKPLIQFRNKPGLLLSASPSWRGGWRMLPSLREVLLNIGVIVMPDVFPLANADKAFDENDQFKDGKQKDRLYALTRKLVEMTNALKEKA